MGPTLKLHPCDRPDPLRLFSAPNRSAPNRTAINRWADVAGAHRPPEGHGRPPCSQRSPYQGNRQGLRFGPCVPSAAPGPEPSTRP